MSVNNTGLFCGPAFPAITLLIIATSVNGGFGSEPGANSNAVEFAKIEQDKNFMLRGTVGVVPFGAGPTVGFNGPFELGDLLVLLLDVVGFAVPLSTSSSG